MKRLKDIGSITVKCRWITVQGPLEDHTISQGNPEKLNTIPEKALKGRALSKQVGFGQREVTTPSRWNKCDYLYGDSSFSTYTFKYRSRSKTTR